MNRHHNRLRKTEGTAAPGREGEARLLLSMITDSELEEIIAECEAPQNEPDPRAVERCTDAELAAPIFAGRPDLESKARARMAVYLSETKGQAVRAWPDVWLKRRIEAGRDPATNPD